MNILCWKKAQCYGLANLLNNRKHTLIRPLAKGVRPEVTANYLSLINDIYCKACIIFLLSLIASTVTAQCNDFNLVAIYHHNTGLPCTHASDTPFTIFLYPQFPYLTHHPSPPLLPYVLRMRTTRDHGANFAPLHDLGNNDLGKRDRIPHLLRNALDLDLVAHARRRQVAHVDVDGDARLLAQVPGRDGHAARPVDDGRRHGPVDPAPRVDVVAGQREARPHVPFARRSDPHRGEQEVVDRAVGERRGYDLLDVRAYCLIVFYNSHYGDMVVVFVGWWLAGWV